MQTVQTKYQGSHELYPSVSFLSENKRFDKGNQFQITNMGKK